MSSTGGWVSTGINTIILNESAVTESINIIFLKRFIMFIEPSGVQLGPKSYT